MALVTIQRSPSPSTDPGLDTVDSSEDVSEGRSQLRKRSKTSKEKLRKIFSTVRFISKLRPCLSESYFTVKGAALILPHTECTKKSSKKSHGGEIQSHLQAMLHLLRPEDTIKIAVRLEDIFYQNHRYMALVSTRGRQDTEEAVILGIDCTGTEAHIGLVLPVWMGLGIKLGGDGGFSLCTDEHSYLFKPVSVQAMWSAYQSLAKALRVAEEMKYIPEGLTHTWIGYYKSRVDCSDASRSRPWKAEGVEVFAPSSLSIKTDDENENIRVAISYTLKEVMMTVDLDEATSIMLRTAVEEKLGLSLAAYKSYFDEEVMRILGQMDAPSKILDFLYLGSEWNASNLEELKEKGISYILNVTKEIDNFFVGMFQYYNVRVVDVEESDLLKHWDKTFRFISKARSHKSKVLVHCKMGVSRSASTVMAFLMKDRRWTVQEAYDFVKERRSCVHPNSGFMEQLYTYEGILTASNKRDIFRCKSDQNLLDEGTKEETDLPQGSFLGDSLFHMMSHSDWPSASGGVANEEEWIQSLQPDGQDFMQMDTDLETAESRSADSMEEAFPDVPSPSPPPDMGSGGQGQGPAAVKPFFSTSQTDVEMVTVGQDVNSESEAFPTWSPESGEKCSSLHIPPASLGALGSRIKPDSSWIKLESEGGDLQKTDSRTENLPYIDALPSDDLYSDTQSDSVTACGTSAGVESLSGGDRLGKTAAGCGDESVKTSVSSTGVPASMPHQTTCGAFSSYISPEISTTGQGEGVQFYLGRTPAECKPAIPKIVVNSDTSQMPSKPLSSVPPMFVPTLDDKGSIDVSKRSASAPQDLQTAAKIGDATKTVCRQEQDTQQTTAMIGQEVDVGALAEGCVIDSPDQQKSPKAEEGDGAVMKTPTRSPKGKIELGVRQYFYKEKIPWKPGKVKKIQEDINRTGQILNDEDGEDGTQGKERVKEMPSDQDMKEDRMLLDQMSEQQLSITLSQSRSCMELFSPGETDGSSISLYEREEIPLEPGTVLRTRLEIEERQRLFCGEGDQEIFGSTRPVVRTSSLKERDTPRSRYSDNRRLTCGPIMSPLTGKSLDDLRSVGTSEVNLSGAGLHSPPTSQPTTEGITTDTSDDENSAGKIKDEETPIEAGHVRKQMRELESLKDSDKSPSRTTTLLDSPTIPVTSSVPLLPSPSSASVASDSGAKAQDSHAMPSSWRQQRQKGNFDSETLALIREIGSALLMSPTPPKPADTEEEESCTNMVKYFVRKIEKQSKTPRPTRNIILLDSEGKKVGGPSDREDIGSKGKSPGTGAELSTSSTFQPITPQADTGKPKDICSSASSHFQLETVRPTDLSSPTRAGGFVMRQEAAHLSSLVKTMMKHSEIGYCDPRVSSSALVSTEQQQQQNQPFTSQFSSPTRDNKHNTAPNSLALVSAAEVPAAGGAGMSTAASPRSRSQSGTCDSPEPSVVRHLVDRFEIKSPESETLASDFGQDYTQRSRDSEDTSLSTSPLTYQKSLSKEEMSSTGYSSYYTAPQSLGSTSQSFFTPISGGPTPQPSSTTLASRETPLQPWLASPVSYSSSSASSSPHLSLDRRQVSLDSAQSRSTTTSRRDPHTFDIAVELQEFSEPTQTPSASREEDLSDVVVRKKGPTPFSRSSMESSNTKSWRPVRPKSADHAQRSTSSSDYDSESSSSDIYQGRKAGNRYEGFPAFEDDPTLRQVSDEGRKIRRLHGKTHPLTKLSGKGPFYSSM